MDTSTIVKLFFVILIGGACGSFLNVCIYRIPLGRSIVRPPSACPSCGHKLLWWENIPVISFLLLKGRCRVCNAGISIQYPIVELIGGIIVAINFWRWNGITPQMMLFSVLGFILIVVAFIDFRYFLINNAVIFTGTIIGIGSIFFLPDFPWRAALFGAVIGGGSLYLARLLGSVLFHKESLGWGDIKLEGMLGIYLGWQKTLLSVGLGFFLPFCLE